MPPTRGGWVPVVYTTGHFKLEFYLEEKCLRKMNALKLTLNIFDFFFLLLNLYF